METNMRILQTDYELDLLWSDLDLTDAVEIEESTTGEKFVRELMKATLAINRKI